MMIQKAFQSETQVIHWLKLKKKKKIPSGASLVVQWLRRLHGSNTEGTGLIPDQTKIPHAVQCSQKKKSLVEIRVGRLSLSGCSGCKKLSPVFIQFWGCRVFGFLIAQLVKNPPVMQETLVQFLDWEDLLEKG